MRRRIDHDEACSRLRAFSRGKNHAGRLAALRAFRPGRRAWLDETNERRCSVNLTGRRRGRRCQRECLVTCRRRRGCRQSGRCKNMSAVNFGGKYRLAVDMLADVADGPPSVRTQTSLPPLGLSVSTIRYRYAAGCRSRSVDPCYPRRPPKARCRRAASPLRQGSPWTPGRGR